MIMGPDGKDQPLALKYQSVSSQESTSSNTKSKVRGRPLIIWGDMVRISADEFFSETLRMSLFSKEGPNEFFVRVFHHAPPDD